MEKIRKYLIAVTLASAAIILCGCYRQTTVILAPGDTFPLPATLPREILDVETATPSQETTSSTETAKPTESENKQAGNSSTAHKPGKKPQPDNSKETTPATEATSHAKSTIPIETTTTAEPTAPLETTVPMETTVPAETTVPETESLLHPVYDINSHSVGSYEQSILDALNGYRADAGMPLLSIHKKLSALAAIRAYECSEDFSHTRPDGRSWDTVLSDYGASASTESILYASSGTSAVHLIDACIGSDSHRQKILNSNYSTVGIGIYHAGSYVFIVMIFR